MLLYGRLTIVAFLLELEKLLVSLPLLLPAVGAWLKKVTRWVSGNKDVGSYELYNCTDVVKSLWFEEPNDTHRSTVSTAASSTRSSPRPARVQVLVLMWMLLFRTSPSLRRRYHGVRVSPASLYLLACGPNAVSALRLAVPYLTLPYFVTLTSGQNKTTQDQASRSHSHSPLSNI
jgi:hypothetical protein